MRAVLIALLLAAGGQAAPQASRIYELAELAYPQIDALDRARTIFILPIGMIEQHGPHLPVGADTLGVMHEARATARRASRAMPQWNIVMMPALNYGNVGANVMGGMAVHPGTYAIRQATLRSVVADIGGDLARNRFKWIFVLSGHAAPPHNVAINEACDFVSETFNVTMLNVTALFRADAAIQARGRAVTARHYSERERASFGIDVHAGVDETSAMLALRPDLVRPMFRTLPPQSGQSFEELQKLTRTPGWQGYLSSPSHATARYGRAQQQWWDEGLTEVMLRAMRGENMFALPRSPAAVPPPVAAVMQKALQEETAFHDSLEKWLAARRAR